MIRIGCGFDVHAFCRGRKLILGGVDIAHDFGLAGHSDADVLTHALCDALLGALAMGDIGEHFPDSDSRYAGASSIDMLAQIATRARENGAVILNADTTIAMEKPKLLDYRDAMRASLAKALSLPVARVSVKATTCEKLGFVGRREGAAAFAVVLANDGN